jgi:hypothetical protein
LQFNLDFKTSASVIRSDLRPKSSSIVRELVGPDAT